MSGNTGTLITFHPTEGVRSVQGISFEQAEMMSERFALENYPHAAVHSAWLLKSWWYMKDDGRPFFTPRPWPIAGFFTDSGLRDTFQGQLPKWVAAVAMNDSSFTFVASPDKSSMRLQLVQMLGQHGCNVEDNAAGGFTVRWQPEEGDPIEVAYAFQLVA